VGLKRRTRDNRRGTFTYADEQLLTLIQGQIATAVDLNRLDSERHELASARAKELSRLTELFARGPDLKAVLERAVATVPALVRGVNCSIFLWDWRANAFVLAASNGLSHELVGKARYHPGEGLTGFVGLHGKPLVLAGRTEPDLQGVHPEPHWKDKYREDGLPADMTRRPFLAVPIRREGSTIGVMRVSDRYEGVFSEADVHLLTIVAGHIAAAEAYGRRHEERVKLLKEVQRLMVLPKTLHVEPGGHRFESALLDEAIRSAADVLKADILTVHRYDRDTGEFETPPRWRGQLKHPEFMETPLHPGDLPWRILRDGSHYWDDVRIDPHLIRAVPARDGQPPRASFAAREAVLSTAGVRLALADRPIGVLFLSFRESQSFAADAREIIETFGANIAVCLEVERLYRQLEVSMSRSASRFLAVELHDGLLGVLFPLVLRAGKAREHLETGDYRAVGDALAFIEKAGIQCQTEARIVMGLLANHAVEDLGFEAALKAYAADFCGDLDVAVDTAPGAFLPITVQRHIYRICVTALTNVVKYAAATRVRISLRLEADAVELAIQDDGRGFDPEAVRDEREHFGLAGIRWRVERLGGEFRA
jgi:GAF domain-containing protein